MIFVLFEFFAKFSRGIIVFVSDKFSIIFQNRKNSNFQPKFLDIFTTVNAIVKLKFVFKISHIRDEILNFENGIQSIIQGKIFNVNRTLKRLKIYYFRRKRLIEVSIGLNKTSRDTKISFITSNFKKTSIQNKRQIN